MKSSIFLAIIFLFSLGLLSCNKNSDAPSATLKSEEDQLKEATDVTDFATKIPANNYNVVKSNLTNEEQNEMYNVGCTKPGSPYGGSSKNEMEAQLTMGQIFKEQSGSQSIGQNFSLISMESKIMEVKPMSVVYEMNYADFETSDEEIKSSFNSVEDFFSAKPHFLNERIYEVSTSASSSFVRSQDKNLKINFSSAGANYMERVKNRLNSMTWCHVDYAQQGATNPEEQTVDKVNYNFNNQFIPAYVEHSKQVSKNIVCTKSFYSGDGSNSTKPKPDVVVNMGPGTYERTEIKSNALLNKGFYECGGVSIYYTSQIVLDSGKMLQSSVTKMSEAPLR